MTQDLVRSKVEFEAQSSPILTPNSWKKLRLRAHMGIQIFRAAYRNQGNIRGSIHLVRALLKKFQNITDVTPFAKVAKVDGRYFWRMVNPGYPSEAIGMMLDNEMNRIHPVKPHHGLRSLLIGITKKCPLQCEHCFEWNNLNKKEVLTSDDIIRMVHSYQDFGTNQIVFGGGEPMVRIKDLYKVLKTARPISDFWIYTSGFGMTVDHAHKLKAAGLTGIIVSIDHHEADGHDRFRGYPGAFEAATQACIHARQAGLVVALSLCTTREYTTEENISNYMDMARKLGVCFVQFVEARSVGRYQNEQVYLPDHQIEVLQKAFSRYNNQPEYWDYPILTWPDQQRRNVGCMAGGIGFFYIDTDGDAHSCPFCSGKVCSALDREAHEVIEELQKGACHVADWSNL